MAFSKDLEEIIEAALADGVLTDKERAVLHKKATQEGVDPDELDVVIEGRLAKMKREVDWLKPAPPASEKRGNIVKCPSCGEPVPGGAAVCPLCGHEFRNVAANKTAVEFAKSLSDLRNKISSYGFIKASDGARELYGFIVNYPIPNTCDDLLEFLTSLQPKAKKGGPLSEDQAYYELYIKCINKAKLNFAQDSRFKPYFDYYDKAKKKMGLGLKVVIFFVVLFSLLGIGGWLLSNSSSKDKEQAESQRTELVSKISKLGSPNEENYDSLRNCLIRINWTGDKSDRMVRDAYNTFFEEKRAYATILNAFYKKHHNGEDDAALVEILSSK